MAIITGPKGLVEAAMFYCKLLDIEKENFYLDIVRKKMEPGTIGMCLDMEEYGFEIILDRRGKKPIYSVLAHEMVHLKQYVLGEMIDLSPRECIWHGQHMKYGSDFYWDSPWEIEAYGRQEGLYARWLEKQCHTQKN